MWPCRGRGGHRYTGLPLPVAPECGKYHEIPAHGNLVSSTSELASNLMCRQAMTWHPARMRRLEEPFGCDYCLVEIGAEHCLLVGKGLGQVNDNKSGALREAMRKPKRRCAKNFVSFSGSLSTMRISSHCLNSQVHPCSTIGLILILKR